MTTIHKDRAEVVDAMVSGLIDMKWEIEKSSFGEGDFGDLERRNYKSGGKWASIDFWSSGVVTYEAVDMDSGNFLIGPAFLEADEVVDVLEALAPFLNFIRNPH
jgi:hypothetical protein